MRTAGEGSIGLASAQPNVGGGPAEAPGNARSEGDEVAARVLVHVEVDGRAVVVIGQYQLQHACISTEMGPSRRETLGFRITDHRNLRIEIMAVDHWLADERLQAIER